MKEYWKEIANSKPSEDAPLPQLERHQAWILVGGCNKHYKNLETYSLAADTFSYYIVPDVMRELDNLFKKRLKPTKGYVSLWAHMDNFLKYDLPDHIPDHPYYITNVLTYEVLTKLIMDIEKCDYEMATGIGLGENAPTKTPYGLQ